MDSKPLNLNYTDQSRLLTAAVIGLLLFSIYTLYSIQKFNILSKRSLVKNNVVMKVIQHGVKSVCPRCGTKGLPYCPRCHVEMYWNGYLGKFICPACGQGGFPQCPRCQTYMSWIEAR